MAVVAARPASSPAATGADLATAARVAAGLLTVAGATAFVVWLVAAAAVRELLGFGFAGTPNRVGEATGIFLNNARLLAGLGLAAFMALMVGQAGSLGRGTRAAMWACDAVVATAAVGHALIVGAGVGAYGERMVRALLPHGPIELAAFALGLALYVAARRERVDWPRGAMLLAGGLAGLAIAAPLEVFVDL